MREKVYLAIQTLSSPSKCALCKTEFLTFLTIVSQKVHPQVTSEKQRSMRYNKENVTNKLNVMFQVRHRFYMTVSGLIFATIGILHGLRAYYGWDAVVAGWVVPIWFSWLVVLVAFIMALSAIKSMK